MHSITLTLLSVSSVFAPDIVDERYLRELDKSINDGVKNEMKHVHLNAAETEISKAREQLTKGLEMTAEFTLKALDSAKEELVKSKQENIANTAMAAQVEVFHAMQKFQRLEKDVKISQKIPSGVFLTDFCNLLSLLLVSKINSCQFLSIFINFGLILFLQWTQDIEKRVYKQTEKNLGI